MRFKFDLFNVLYNYCFFRLFGLYLYLHHHIHSSGQPLKILCHVGCKEMLLGWVRTECVNGYLYKFCIVNHFRIYSTPYLTQQEVLYNIRSL